MHVLVGTKSSRMNPSGSVQKTIARTPMLWMVVSLGNGKCWNGSLERYLRVLDRVSKLDAERSRTDGYSSFFDYFALEESHAAATAAAIRAILAHIEYEDEIAYDLSVLYEIYLGGKVIMG